MTESAVALGVVGSYDSIVCGGGVWGGGGPSRISDLQVRSGPKMGHCGQRREAKKTPQIPAKMGPELYIVIARTLGRPWGLTQNTVNYGKICGFAFLGRCGVSSFGIRRWRSQNTANSAKNWLFSV